MKTWVSLGVFLSLISVGSAFGIDKPGGLTRTAVSQPIGTYEIALSPSYTFEPGGAFLSSEFRMQYDENFAFGFGLGAGEIGFNLGANALWHIFPDTTGQPGVALLGGIYYLNLQQSGLAFRVTPIVSKAFPTTWGHVTPYGSATIAIATGDFTMKASTGVEFQVKSWGGMSLWTEFGLGITHAPHEVVFGISYPFSSFGA